MLHLLPVENTEQVILEQIYGHTEKMIGSSEHGFLKAKSYLINLIASCDKMTKSTGRWKTLDVSLDT